MVLVGSALKSAMMLSVVAVPVAVPVTTVAQAPEEIADVPRALEPLAIVWVTVAEPEAVGMANPLSPVVWFPVAFTALPLVKLDELLFTFAATRPESFTSSALANPAKWLVVIEPLMPAIGSAVPLLLRNFHQLAVESAQMA